MAGVFLYHPSFSHCSWRLVLSVEVRSSPAIFSVGLLALCNAFTNQSENIDELRCDVDFCYLYGVFDAVFVGAAITDVAVLLLLLVLLFCAGGDGGGGGGGGFVAAWSVVAAACSCCWLGLAWLLVAVAVGGCLCLRCRFCGGFFYRSPPRSHDEHA